MAFHNRGLALVFLNKIPSACKDFQRSSEIGYFDSKKKWMNIVNDLYRKFFAGPIKLSILNFYHKILFQKRY
ncbi:hypothetical protein LEP1GSC116_4288 [Leptospira interrogans serovar Icterohaemorrhagiae str. Verdun HP]|uniref:Tetratricopeptide repeat protein n=1 Tax=Leptospira interrogans serovar Icterohaemorrhagiae str. Verdun HP TaxID=1049910 RepID=M6RNX6_LEPIR|nr:hypothetical protein LEP1GSC116_4288 [Leptospira interrogans serovar Icterohaemorrhagiae str. Verdun HP]